MRTYRKGQKYKPDKEEGGKEERSELISSQLNDTTDFHEAKVSHHAYSLMWSITVTPISILLASPMCNSAAVICLLCIMSW